MNIPLSGLTEDSRLRALLSEAQQAIEQRDTKIAELERDRMVLEEGLAQAHHQIGLRDNRIETLAQEFNQLRGAIGELTEERVRLYQELEQLRLTLDRQVMSSATVTEFSLGGW